jgi:hypothetical protein
MAEYVVFLPVVLLPLRLEVRGVKRKVSGRQAEGEISFPGKAGFEGKRTLEELRGVRRTRRRRHNGNRYGVILPLVR